MSVLPVKDATGATKSMKMDGDGSGGDPHVPHHVVDAIIPGTGATNLGKAVDSAAGATDTGVALLAVRDDALSTLTPADGDYVTVRVDSQGRLHVTGSTSGSIAGDVAHDSADTGNPVKIGARARTSNVAAVANDDRSDLVSDVIGRQVISPYALDELSVSGVTSAITGTSDTSVIAAPGAGIRLYITTIIVANSHATVGTIVEIKDDTTVLLRVPAAAVNGGAVLTFPKPLRLTANKALQAANLTTGSNTYVSAVGYLGP